MDGSIRVRLLDDSHEAGTESTPHAKNAPTPESASPCSVSVQPVDGSKRADETSSSVQTRSWNSLDFSVMDSAVHEAFELGKSPWDGRAKVIERWFLLAAIGVGVGCIAFVITWSSQTLQHVKLSLVSSQIARELGGNLFFGVSLVTFMAMCWLYALAAALPTAYVAPAAAGSGISEVKGYLNGIALPKVLRLKTLMVKVWGNIFALSSGGPLGAEGPMIHIGAIVASGLSQGKSTVLGLDTKWLVHRHFRTDIERRDFVAAGTAAGVAAAFGAPVGGVLFVIEEGASHWHRALTWRTFFCAVVAAYTVDFLFTGIGTPNDPPTGWGQLTHPGMFSFGTFSGEENANGWSLWELPVFMAIGACGGLFGAVFVWASRKLMRARAKYSPVTSPAVRVLEVMLFIGVNSMLKFVTPYLLGQCNERPADNGAFRPTLVQFYCKDGYYNDLATLFMGTSEDVIRSLFHFTHSDGDTGPSPFTAGRLGVFFAIYAITMTVCNGLAWPSGLFIPSLLAGSAFGRLVGECLNVIPSSILPGVSVDPGTYALVGAAAVLCGTSRLTITLSALLLESTGNYVFSLPIMVTILSARVVGGIFNHSIYDALIEEKGWPLLAERPPRQFKHLLRAGDVMARLPVTVPCIVTAGQLHEILKSCDHHGFPVEHTDGLLRAHPRLGNLAGYIQWRHLAVLLSRRTFHAALPSVPFAAGSDVVSDVKAGRQAASYSVNIGKALASSRSENKPPVSRVMEMRTRRYIPGDRKPQGSPHTIRLRMPSVPSMSVDALMESNHLVNRSLEPPVVGGLRGRTDSGLWRRERMGSTARGLAESSRHSTSGHLLSLIGEDMREDKTLNGPVAGKGVNAHPSIGTQSNAQGGIESASTGRTPAVSGGSERQLLGEDGDAIEMEYKDEPLLSWSVLESHYPHYPDIHTLVLTPTEQAMYVDLRPYMDPCPVTVAVHAPLQRAHQLFRACGLRHLMVTNDCHDVVGIISRMDLMTNSLEGKLLKKTHRTRKQAGVWEFLLTTMRGTADAVSGVLRVPAPSLTTGPPSMILYPEDASIQ